MDLITNYKQIFKMKYEENICMQRKYKINKIRNIMQYYDFII